MLHTSDLSYSYRWRRKDVISELTWAIRPGGVTMLLGPNGAGKSTLLKLLSGRLRPDHGGIWFDGREVSRRDLWRLVSWMPQDVQPARGMRAAEQVEYAGWLAGMSRRESREAAGQALEKAGLSPQANERASALSGGQLRRLGLAQAVVQRGSVLLLDEPTAGLDPAQAMNFRNMLRELRYPGGIVVSTHQAADIEADIDFVAVLADGKLQFDGTIDEFRGLVNGAGGAETMAKAYAQVMSGSEH